MHLLEGDVSREAALLRYVHGEDQSSVRRNAATTLVELDRQYPDDERILEMKGTLYVRLNRPKEAKKAWERVLSLNPNNETVARALERLETDGE